MPAAQTEEMKLFQAVSLFTARLNDLVDCVVLQVSSPGNVLLRVSRLARGEALCAAEARQPAAGVIL